MVGSGYRVRVTVARVCEPSPLCMCSTCVLVYKHGTKGLPITFKLFKEGSVECGEHLRLHARARERDSGPLVSSRLLLSLRLPRGSSPHECQQASRAPQHAARLTHHMPASPGIISLLTYTKAVMPSLPVVLKRILATGWIFEKPWPHHT